MSGISWPRGSVHEPGAAAGDGRPPAPSLVYGETVRFTEHQQSSLNYRRKGTCPEDLAVMEAMDQQYLSTPFYGSRRMRVLLGSQKVNRKRVQRLMRVMGLRAVYQRPRASKPGTGHKVYPYLLGGLEIARPDQLWAADITYIPMAKGFLYLVAIMDLHTRFVVAWRLSNTLDADLCVMASEEALSKGTPEVFNTDQRACPDLAKGVASSPGGPSPASWSSTGSGSAWTGKGGTPTTFSSKGCGAR